MQYNASFTTYTQSDWRYAEIARIAAIVTEVAGCILMFWATLSCLANIQSSALGTGLALLKGFCGYDLMTIGMNTYGIFCQQSYAAYKRNHNLTDTTTGLFNQVQIENRSTTDTLFDLIIQAIFKRCALQSIYVISIGRMGHWLNNKRQTSS